VGSHAQAVVCENLYISCDGHLEPLGESQVVNCPIKLAPFHCITVSSFEKPTDLAKSDRVQALEGQLRSAANFAIAMVHFLIFSASWYQVPILPFILIFSAVGASELWPGFWCNEHHLGKSLSMVLSRDHA
jgi:hypothetical protein